VLKFDVPSSRELRELASLAFRISRDRSLKETCSDEVMVVAESLEWLVTEEPKESTNEARATLIDSILDIWKLLWEVSTTATVIAKTEGCRIRRSKSQAIFEDW